jgi:hypothetical protein
LGGAGVGVAVGDGETLGDTDAVTAGPGSGSSDPWQPDSTPTPSSSPAMTVGKRIASL